MDIGKLMTRWFGLFQQYAEIDYIYKGLEDLVQKYTEPNRHYHNLNHVNTCLNAFDQTVDHISDKFCVEAAIWFHDVIYDPQKGDNEHLSAKHASAFLGKTNVEEKKISKIENLICLTKHPANPLSGDEKILLDIDLMILGSEPKLYEEYEKSIRKEYSFVPSHLYKMGRKKLLKSFIERKKIFETSFFVQRYETQARDNLEKAINNL
jgi:predicted metal-dependent HD superfamily phosphohydrolase